MNTKEFKKNAIEIIEWIVDYFDNIENYPVKSRVQPGDISHCLPRHPPIDGESMETAFNDFKEIILPGITHWQSPSFHAYFTSNNSFPSILGELLSSALGVQGMVWETSPAATELEEVVMNWLKEMTGLPETFHGVIQDTASTSTLTALLSAREKISGFRINESGFEHNKYRIYCSSEAHSSIEKDVKIAGFGKNSLVKISVRKDLSMNPDLLEKSIKEDLEKDYIPVCVVSAIGTTGTVAIDPVAEISKICRKYNIWHHIDAAYAGTAMVLEEYRKYIKGIEEADSYVFNPHKWMFTNFDCSAYFVKDKETLIHTFEIMPEYLKTASDNQVNNYRDWGIQLGRRFRALKLWFVIREMGVEGIQNKIRNHIRWAGELAEEIRSHKQFEMHEPQNLGLVCFRLKSPGDTIKEKNNKNALLLKNINDSGKAYLSHTTVNGEYTLRMVIGQTNVSKQHVMDTWDLIRHEGRLLIHS